MINTLREVCADGGLIQTGPFGSQLHAHDYLDDGVPVIMPTNIGENRVVEDGVARVSEEMAESLARHRLRLGDIVYSRRGDITRRALIRDEAGWLCGTGCLLVRPGPGADPVWLSYWLGTPDTHSWLIQHAVGATMPNLNTQILGDVPVALPPLDEQRRIAEVLGALDDLIDANEFVASRAISLAKSLAERASDRLVNLSVLAELADFRTVVPPGDVDHFSLPAFDNGVMPERVDGAQVKSNKTLLESEVVLVSRLNPHIPRVWVVYPDSEVMNVASTEFVPMRGLDAAVEEIFALVSSDRYLSQLSSRVTGTTGSHQRVDKKALFELFVSDVRQLPSSAREVIIDLVQEAHSSRKMCAVLRRTRDELLPLLMSGAVRVRPVGVAA